MVRFGPRVRFGLRVGTGMNILTIFCYYIPVQNHKNHHFANNVPSKVPNTMKKAEKGAQNKEKMRK
jgi:hypothetical protein